MSLAKECVINKLNLLINAIVVDMMLFGLYQMNLTPYAETMKIFKSL
ncbi:MAG TPA: hypothetical protein VKA95_17770 [Nitrososphaeraceae archaeon]|nr:hypothetical protein [Nitrososphaeraceae archaeon]